MASDSDAMGFIIVFGLRIALFPPRHRLGDVGSDVSYSSGALEGIGWLYSTPIPLSSNFLYGVASRNLRLYSCVRVCVRRYYLYVCIQWVVVLCNTSRLVFCYTEIGVVNGTAVSVEFFNK